MHLIERDVADDRGGQRGNPHDVVPRPRAHVALQAGDDVHGLTVHREVRVRPRLRGLDVGGMASPKRARIWATVLARLPLMYSMSEALA